MKVFKAVEKGGWDGNEDLRRSLYCEYFYDISKVNTALVGKYFCFDTAKAAVNFARQRVSWETYREYEVWECEANIKGISKTPLLIYGGVTSGTLSHYKQFWVLGRYKRLKKSEIGVIDCIPGTILIKKLEFKKLLYSVYITPAETKVIEVIE